MKKLRTTLAAFLLLLIAMPVLQSCLDDWNDDERSSLTIGTVRIIDGKDYYFALDEGTRMFPGDTAQVNNYTLVAFTVAAMNKPVIAQVCCHRFFVNNLNLNLLLNLQHFDSCASRTFLGTLHHLSTNLCRRYLYFLF